MTQAPATVFIVDDDPSVRRGLSRLIRLAGMNVEAFASAVEFLRREPFHGNGCIVLDIRMPGITGPELQDALAGKEHSLPVVFLTSHGSVPASVTAMKKGAIDFLQKPVDERDLLHAIEIALARDRESRSRHAQVRELRVRLDKLTSREREVLEFVIAGLLNKQIASEMGIAEKTVKIHRGRVMKKMQVASVAELVRMCQAAGIPPRNAVV